MKKEIIPALLLSAVLMILLCAVYPAFIWLVAKAAPGHGEGTTVTAANKTYYVNIGQKFTADKYFWSRPSAVDYNAAGSGGSNKGPANPDFLKQVSDRADTFLVHNPGMTKNQIPVEMVTASGSGLDPDLSPEGAMAQVHRVASARHLTDNQVASIVTQTTQQPLLGMFGPRKVNVLKLNLAMDALHP